MTPGELFPVRQNDWVLPMVLTSGIFSLHTIIFRSCHNYSQEFPIQPPRGTPKSTSLTQSSRLSFRFISVPCLLCVSTWRPQRHPKLSMTQTEFIEVCLHGHLHSSPSPWKLRGHPWLVHLRYPSNFDLWLFLQPHHLPPSSSVASHHTKLL